MTLDDVTDGLVCNVKSSSRGRFEPSGGGVVVTRDAGIDLWTKMTQLPHAGQMRCHTPRYGISLSHHGGYYWFATICWKCNNIFISCDGSASHQEFDGQSPEAQQLLADIRALVGDDDSAGEP